MVLLISKSECDVILGKESWKLISCYANAIRLLEKNLDKIHWYNLSSNPNAISILEKIIDKIHWNKLSLNPNAISMLEKNLDKINWYWLSGNPNAMSFLEKNLDKINWSNLCCNKGVNELNYQWLKDRMDIIREDLMKAVYHPKRLEYYLEYYDYDIFD